jgi:transcription elongation factor Elf1
MWLAGKKQHLLKTNNLSNVYCKNCNTYNATQVQVFGTYKFILNIPFLAGKKFGLAVCKHCNKSISYEKMSTEIKLAYFELKETVKNPIWFYSGFIAIKTLVLLKIFSKYF